MFTVDRKRVIDFCTAMANSDTGFTWSCSARTDRVDDKLLEEMKRAGCCGIFYGVETGSARLQQTIHKNLDIPNVEKVIDQTERLGIRSTVSLITGFPDETLDDLRQTVSIFFHSARCARSKPQLNLLSPLAGTPLYLRHSAGLVLEEMCSEMSHQGVSQDSDDMNLIRSYPKIFPNFYRIPTPHLDAKLIFELHEFLMASVERFRWLLVALDYVSTDILTFFRDWKAHRVTLRPDLAGPALRIYYQRAEYRCDFLVFLHSHAVYNSAVIASLVEMEEAIGLGSPTELEPIRYGRLLAQGAPILLGDIPERSEDTRVLKLSVDMQSMIEDLKSRIEPKLKLGKYWYVTDKSHSGKLRLNGISDWVGELLGACDGLRTVEEVRRAWYKNVSGVEERSLEYVFLRLLVDLQGRRTIRIRRPNLHR